MGELDFSSSISPHHVNGFGVIGEAESITTGSCAKVDSHHHSEGSGWARPDFIPL